MNNLNINNFKFIKNNDNYIYTFEIKNSKYILKRISNNNEIVSVKIFNNEVEFIYIKNQKKFNLNTYEKDLITNDILNNLKSSNILINFIDFNELSNLIKQSYINIVYSNELLGLSFKNSNLIYVVLLETNSIIGTIKIDYDVRINVDEIYIKESLELLSEYTKSKKKKKLIKNNFL